MYLYYIKLLMMPSDVCDVGLQFIERTGIFMTMTGWLDDSEEDIVRGYCEGERVYIDGVSVVNLNIHVIIRNKNKMIKSQSKLSLL